MKRTQVLEVQVGACVGWVEAGREMLGFSASGGPTYPNYRYAERPAVWPKPNAKDDGLSTRFSASPRSNAYANEK